MNNQAKINWSKPTLLLCVVSYLSLAHAETPIVDKERNKCADILSRFDNFVKANEGAEHFRSIIQEFYSAEINKGVNELLVEDAAGKNVWNDVHELYLLFPRHRMKVHTESASCIGRTNSIVVLISGDNISHIENIIYIEEDEKWVIDSVFEGEAFQTNLPIKFGK